MHPLSVVTHIMDGPFDITCTEQSRYNINCLNNYKSDTLYQLIICHWVDIKCVYDLYHNTKFSYYLINMGFAFCNLQNDMYTICHIQLQLEHIVVLCTT